MKVLAKIVFSISLSVIFILISVQLVSTKTYLMISKDKYERHEEVTWDYEFAAENIMDYLNGKRDNLYFGASEEMSSILMTDRGISHMEDVRVLYDNGRILIAVSIVFAAISGIFLWDKKEFWKTLKRVWIFPSIVISIVGVMMIIGFNWAFTLFHELLFTNDLWMLSSNDPLLVMLPLNFFMVTAIVIIVFTVIFHAITVWLGFKFLKDNTSV